MHENTSTIDFNGIQLSLKLTPFALEKYGQEMAELLKAYPDDWQTYGAPCSAAALVYWGHHEHCKETDFPMIYSIDDFIAWAANRMKTEDGAIEIGNLHLLYVKLIEG